MKLFFWSFALSASLVIGIFLYRLFYTRYFLPTNTQSLAGQITPGSRINAFNPCVAPRATDASGETRWSQYATLFTQADVDAISGCEVFNGSIWISSQFLGDLFLPKLKTLYGRLEAGPNFNNPFGGVDTLTRIDLSSLQVVEEDVYFGMSVDIQNVSSLGTVSLPSIRDFIHLNFQNLPRLSNIYIGSYANTTELPGARNGYARVLINASEALFVDLSSTYDLVSMSSVMNSAGLATFSLNSPSVYNLVVNASDIRLPSSISISSRLEISGCDSQSGKVVSIGDKYQLLNSSLLAANVTVPRNGDVVIENNPGLTKLSFSSSEQYTDYRASSKSYLDSMRISNCTSLSQISLAGAGLQTLEKSLNITDNGSLSSIDFPDLTTVQGSVSITDNGALSSIDCPDLTVVGGSVYITDNGALSSIDFPDLTTVRGSIYVTNCTTLSDISFPKLTFINGDILLVGNDQLSIITGFPQLSTIGGSVDFRGTFSDVTLPSLRRVWSNFNINSTISASYCKVFDKYRDSSVYYNKDPSINGNYSCVDPSRPKTKTLRAPRKPPSSRKNGLSSGETAGIVIGSIVVFGLVLWATSWLVDQRRDTLDPPVELQPQANLPPPVYSPGSFHKTTDPFASSRPTNPPLSSTPVEPPAYPNPVEPPAYQRPAESSASASPTVSPANPRPADASASLRSEETRA